MTNFLNKHFALIITLMVVVLFVTIWLSPANALTAWMVFMALGLAINIFLITQKFRETYLLGRISQAEYLHETSFYITCVLLIVILAGLSGRYIAEIVTNQINNESARFSVGIITGLFVGVGVGLLARKTMNGFHILYLRIWSRNSI